MASRRSPGHPGLCKPVKDPHRTAAFREVARAIVGKDRYDRRAGLSMDTAGAIARALERAYAQGFLDAQALAAPSSVATGSDEADGPVEWVLIPPRPRDAFWTTCLFTLGRDTTAGLDKGGHLYPAMLPSGRPGWRLVTRTGREDKPFGHATMLPLVRLGLLQVTPEPDRRLLVSARGVATWRRFLQRGGQFPEDLTDPAR